MAYRWRTDGVPMAYRWRTDGLQMAYGAPISQGRGDDIVFHAQRRRQADFELRGVKSVHRRRRRCRRRCRRVDDFADLLNLQQLDLVVFVFRLGGDRGRGGRRRLRHDRRNVDDRFHWCEIDESFYDRFEDGLRDIDEGSDFRAYGSSFFEGHFGAGGDNLGDHFSGAGDNTFLDSWGHFGAGRHHLGDDFFWAGDDDFFGNWGHFGAGRGASSAAATTTTSAAGAATTTSAAGA